MNDIFDDFPVVENGKVISPDLEDVASVEGKGVPCTAGNGSAKDEADGSIGNESACEVVSRPLSFASKNPPSTSDGGYDTEGASPFPTKKTGLDNDIICDEDCETEFADDGEVISDVPDSSLDVDIDEKYRKLVDFYLVCGNKGKAAKLAGYDSDNPNSLRAMACRDFKRPEVIAYLKLRRAEISKKAEISYESYMSELVSIATLDVADVVETHLVRHTIENEPVYMVTFKNISDIPEYARKAVKQIKQNKDGSTELIFYDKLQALKLLGQIKGYLASDGGADDTDETGIALIPEVNIDEE